MTNDKNHSGISPAQHPTPEELAELTHRPDPWESAQSHYELVGKDIPIHEVTSYLVDQLGEKRIILLAGRPASGKSTLMEAFKEHGFGGMDQDWFNLRTREWRAKILEQALKGEADIRETKSDRLMRDLVIQALVLQKGEALEVPLYGPGGLAIDIDEAGTMFYHNSTHLYNEQRGIVVAGISDPLYESDIPYLAVYLHIPLVDVWRKRIGRGDAIKRNGTQPTDDEIQRVSTLWEQFNDRCAGEMPWTDAVLDYAEIILQPYPAGQTEQGEAVYAYSVYKRKLNKTNGV